MMKLLLDIAPLPEDFRRPEYVIDNVHRHVADTVDTIGTIGRQVIDTTPTGGHNNIWIILGVVAAALVGLGFLILMTRSVAARRVVG